ncbi:MAG: transposase [Bacteroidota bacterium]|nr:MAG: transposase [Bacteroidota bacterium]
MSRKYKFKNPEGIYFISFATVYWIDVFIRNEYKEIVIESWKYCQKEKGLNIYAWIIMTSHVHMIIGSKTNKLEDVVRDMKSFTSRKLKDAIKENKQESRREWMLWMMERAGRKNSNNNNFQFWQQHNKPIELSDNKIMDQKLDYLHNNPVVDGIVNNPEDYVYSSARDYCGIKGLIDIELIC